MTTRLCNLGLSVSCLVMALACGYGQSLGALMAASAAGWFLAMTVREWQ